MEFAGYLALIGIGIVLSLMGGGGSMLSVPILVYLFSLDIITATSYSLFIVGTTSLLGAWLKQKEQRADWSSAFIFSLSSVIAIFSIRKWILPAIPEEIVLADSFIVTKRALILGAFALFVIISSVFVITKPSWSTGDGKQQIKFLLPVSFLTGIIVGFVGAGGGFLILPSLIIFGRLPFRTAIGTTLLVIGVGSLIGFLGDVMNHTINWFFLFMITGLAIGGMLLGNVCSSKIPENYLRLSFGWTMLIIAVGILVKEWMT